MLDAAGRLARAKLEAMRHAGCHGGLAVASEKHLEQYF